MNNSPLNKDIVVSVCTIIEDDIANGRDFVAEVVPVLQHSFRHYEILIIANGSAPETVLELRRIVQGIANTRILVLSKRNDEEVAFTAALESSIGDYVVVMDPAADPPALIPSMLALCMAGHDFVTGQLADRRQQPVLYGVLSRIFYRLFNLFAEQRIESDWSRFLCLSRAMVNNIIQVKDRVRYIKYLNTELGYSQGIITYEQRIRPGREANRHIWGRFKSAVEAIIASSDRLIRMATLASFLISIVNLFYIVYAVVIWLLKPDVAPGWASISVVVASMFTALFMILAVFGEYLSVIYKETKKGPLYHIAREYSSSDLFRDITEKNVTGGAS